MTKWRTKREQEEENITRLTPEQTDNTDDQETQVWRHDGEVDDLGWNIDAPRS